MQGQELRGGRRARVFVSCGQSKQSDEVTIAIAVRDRLRQLGYEPYVAVEEQSLRGLRENIFEQLRRSEYFVFIDFKREALDRSKPPIHRGSLFSHQELAIASFLGLDVLALQENGTKKDDGIIRFLQANAIPFTDRHTLPSVIADKVRERGWNPDWRAELTISRRAEQFSDALIRGLNKTGRFFHLDVHNHHRDRVARNCYAYLEKAVKLDSGQTIPLRAVEFKWAGYLLPNAHIPAGSARPFDAFYILHEFPTVLQFNTFTDSTEYVPRIVDEGEYELTYVTIADDFPTARSSFKLNLLGSLDATTFGR